MAGLRGRTFGGYELVEQLPGGGIADVYRGRPVKAGGRDVVVKVVYPEFAHQPGFLPRFRKIVADSGKLASHPHILPLIASGEDSGYLYLVTPFVEAGTLRDWLRRGGRMGAGDAAPFFRQLCDALTYAHSLGVVHGNLKPSNVLLFEGRHVLVGDFGTLWDVSHMDMNHAGSGTEAVEFLAPEVLSGQVTQLSDIYSVGALLFTTLTGRAPFQAATPAEVFAAAAHHPMPHLAQANPALAAHAQALDSVIQKAMAKRPEDRFPSAAAVAQVIETSIRQAPGPLLGPAQPMAAGAPFGVVSGPTPFGSMPLPPQLQGSHAPFSAPGAVPPSGTIPAGGAPFGAVGGAFPAPAISLAQAAAAIGSGNGGSSFLTQLDPPFPPLPPVAQPEPQMEQARMGGIGGIGGLGGLGGTGMQPAVHPLAGNAPSSALPFSESTVHTAAPGALDVPLQPTMRVPAPGMPGSANAGQQPGTGPTGQPGAGPLPSFDAPPEPRAVRISGAPRAKLGRPGAAPFPSLDDDDEEFAPQSMPAVRPPAGQSGFAVAGGGGSFDPGARGMSAWPQGGFAHGAVPGSAALDSASFTGHPGESGVLDGPAAFGSSDLLGGASAEFPGFGESSEHEWGADSRMSGAKGHDDFGGERFGYGGEHNGPQDGVRWGELGADYTGEHGAQYNGDYYAGARSGSEYGGHAGAFQQAESGADGRPFSATKLDLPRLTSPALVGQPPSWHEIVSDTGGLPAGMPANMYGARNAPAERAPTWEDAGESMWHIAVPSAPREQPRVPQHIEAEWAGTGITGSWQAQGEASGKSKKKKWGRRGQPDEPEDSGFDDDRIWTVGMTAVRGRRRWPRKVALLLVIIILIDLAALVVLRPDLCPTASCRALSSSVRQHLGLSQGAPAAAPFTAIPSSVTLTVANGKSASSSFTISNATSGTVTWKAVATLPWISTNPGGGSLGASGAIALVLTAKPANIKAGTYTANVTVTFAGATTQTVTIPVTINVTG